MDLQSIFPTRKTVPFSNGTVEVMGLSLRKATQLSIEYPDLLALANGKANLAGLIVSAPNAALAIFAQGIAPGPDNVALLEAFDEAPMGQQIELLSVIIDLTFAGERARPFLASLAGRLPDQDGGTSQPTSPPSSDT